MAQLAQRVAEGMRPLWEHEARSLDASSRQAVAREVALTLAEAEVDTRRLLDLRLQPDRLAAYLLEEARPTATATLSQDESAIYRRMIQEISREWVKLADGARDFSRAFAENSLQGQDAILHALLKLAQRPDEESAAL